jgi:hypothetical protein
VLNATVDSASRRTLGNTIARMLRTLSSRQTFLMKMLFPAIWIAEFGIGTLGLWLGTMHGKGGALPPDAIKWQFLTAWIAGTAFILWVCAGLKRVRVDEKSLYLSNYFREITVPLNMIAEVTENRWINIHPVTVHFLTTTEFGQKITFMPTMRFFGLWSSHPVVAELKQLARCDSR